VKKPVLFVRESRQVESPSIRLLACDIFTRLPVALGNSGIRYFIAYSGATASDSHGLPFMVGSTGRVTACGGPKGRVC